MTQEERAARFAYLDELRDSGQTNMMGAAPYLQRRFGLSEEEAKATLFAWMESCEE